MKVLNAGCGTDVMPEAINVDKVDLRGVDVVCDIERSKLPFAEGTFDRIVCNHVLEHMDYIGTMREFHRVLRPGGELRIRVPHFSGYGAYSDPTHIRFFGVGTFEYFVAGAAFGFYFDFSFSRISSCKLRFLKRWLYPWNYILEPFVNASRRTLEFYEGSPLRAFQAHEIQVTLVK